MIADARAAGEAGSGADRDPKEARPRDAQG